MSLLTSIQGKIETKIFNRLGSTVVRSPYLSQTNDKWGDNTPTYDTNEDVTAVPYNTFESKELFRPFGDLIDGETIMAFKHGQSLNPKDKITFNSQTLLIKEIEVFPLSDGFVLKVARLVEQI